jgi:dipeptidyl aminopeptidase/acylaminoacyl peptidase
MLSPYEEYWDQNVRNMKAHDKRTSKKDRPKVEWLFFRLLWGYNVDPIDYAKFIKEPVLIISSKDDTTIPYEVSMSVADRLKACEVVTLTGVKHEHMLSDTSYGAIHEFLYK